MKRLATTLTATALTFLLVACGGGSDIQEPTDVSTGKLEQEEAAPEPTGEAVNEAPEKETEPSTNSGEATIEEVVLLDEAGVMITAKSLDANNWAGPTLNLLIENNSGKALTVQSRSASVNGYMCETMMSTDVADGKKANDGLTFLSNQLELSGVQAIAQIEFSFHVFDAETWDTYLDSKPVSLATSLAGTYEQAYDDSGEVAYEGSGVKIIVKGLSPDNSWLGPSVIVEVINMGDRDVTVQARGTSINGFMVDPFFSTDVCAGKRAVSGVTFASSELEDNGIETIKSVELSFHVFDTDSWDTIVDTDTVTLSF